MAKGFNTELGRLAHRLFEEWDNDGGYYEASDCDEEDMLEILVERGIAVRINSLDFALAPEYR